jgi:predicted RNase H-like HicB family nuclease
MWCREGAKDHQRIFGVIMKGSLQIIIEEDKDGFFAYIPELKGCHTQGGSLEDVMKQIKEAARLYISTLRPAEMKRLKTKRVYTTSLPLDLG